MLPLRLGQARYPSQAERRKWVCHRERRLCSTALLMAPSGLGLMVATEGGPPPALLALVGGLAQPPTQPTYLGHTQGDPALLNIAFFSCWLACVRTTTSSACASSARVTKRYQARYPRTSY